MMKHLQSSLKQANAHLGSRITAVLGPTNTGKTYLAVERMLAYGSGMIGFPLRLLARENYDKIVAQKGADQVALITGEEKIVPPRAKYFVCTVESMPVNRTVDFLAIDEIQLCADPERGHIFTDKLLTARGRHETMFLGAWTMAPIIRSLVDHVELVSRERLSVLEYTGPKKITRLPRRSVVVGFSANDVYAIAELLRRQKGGAAVVLGALSPRTRNAQVEMYQSGEVDYMVATDAIGMGLNMDVDHVAFSAFRKFDGKGMRFLTSAEMGQIAGRAGRYTNNGTFGTTGEIGGLDPEYVSAIESHSFPALKGIVWRNTDLHFSSVAHLLRSLNMPAKHPNLMRARPAMDYLVLDSLSRDKEIMDKVKSPGYVRLLWDVCQIPNYRKEMAETHARLVAQFFTHLLDGEGRLPCDWIASNVNRLDRTDGDIDTLVARIAGIRTWTYISHRGDWLNDTVHWQNTTRLLEDKLSDALHKRLTARFVDRRTAILMRSLRERRQMEAVVAENGQVEVEGQSVGQLIGLRFSAERAGSRLADKAVSQAAEAALRQEIAARVKQLVDDDADKFSITTKGRILWNGADIAELAAGADVLSPTALMLPNDQLSTEQKEHVAARVSQWLRGYVHEVLKPLFLLQGAQDELSGAARGLAFQLGESLGSLPVAAVATDISTLNDADRKALARFGVRFGVVSIFIPLLLKPKAQLLCGLLWACKEGLALADLPDPARVSHKVDDKQAIPVFEAFGFAAAGGYAIRVDMLERFSADVRRILRETEAVDGEVILPPEILPVLGVGADAAKDIIAHLGYKTRVDEDGALKIRPRRRNRKGGGKPQGQKTAGAPDKDKAPAQAAVPAAASAPEGNGMAAPAADAQPADMAATPAADTPAVEAAPAAADTPKPKAKPKAPVKKRPKKKSVKLSQDVDEDSPFAVLKQLKLKD